MCPSACRLECISLFVRESNRAALSFYRKVGFRVHRRVRAYYRSPAPAEDALLLVRGLDSAVEHGRSSEGRRTKSWWRCWLAHCCR